jgi:hypothetical protein
VPQEKTENDCCGLTKALKFHILETGSVSSFIAVTNAREDSLKGGKIYFQIHGYLALLFLGHGEAEHHGGQHVV